ncbi:uncharacterized protein LOC109834655 [Asparagus officinalis]|uniref:uncharacterized protein LOC109834655 n=1 Tax=Asparagus officinalis TaxID=4686 RepID=UPI00098E30FD|nr:uncharacterized protein LOC109834655 [Asparagus officinalis]
MSFFKVFGCIAYAHKPTQLKKIKINENEEKLIFIGYSEESKAYRLHNSDTNKLVVSRDVIFHEAGTWKGEPHHSSTPSIIEEETREAMSYQDSPSLRSPDASTSGTDSLPRKNKTLELVILPEGKELIGLKWIYKTKYNEDGSVQKRNARLVAKDYSQQPAVGFNETFVSIARMETIRTVLAIETQLKLKVFQLNIKSVFLNGELEEEVYVE